MKKMELAMNKNTITKKERYFDSQIKILDKLSDELYSDEKKYAVRYKYFKTAREKFRREYYDYALIFAKEMAKEDYYIEDKIEIIILIDGGCDVYRLEVYSWL